MKLVPALTVVAVLVMAATARAEGLDWPNIAVGERLVLTSRSQIPFKLHGAAGLSTEATTPIELTFFKAPKGRDYVIVSPCCGADENHAALFDLASGMVRQVGLAVGDPRLGFTTQVAPTDIRLGEDLKSIRAHVATTSCEDGDWRYFYNFDEADRLYLRSAIDTSCEHLGVRELYHARNAEVGKWWIK